LVERLRWQGFLGSVYGLESYLTSSIIGVD